MQSSLALHDLEKLVRIERLQFALVLAIAYYAFVNLLSFFSYARDKVQARRGEWRTKETALLLDALLGGFPGALLAMVRLSPSLFSFSPIIIIIIVYKNYFWDYNALRRCQGCKEERGRSSSSTRGSPCRRFRLTSFSLS